MRLSNSFRIGRVGVVAFLVFWSLFPIYWSLNTSLTTTRAAQSRPPHFFPHPATLANYGTIFGMHVASFASRSFGPDFGRSIVNIFVECFGATGIALILAVLGAYAFARLNFTLKRPVFYAILATMALPSYATLIPVYRAMSVLGLVNTYASVILVFVGAYLPLAFWIMFNYFESLPKELEQAAEIDGASFFSVLFRIMLPLSLPGMMTTGIVFFLSTWGMFLFPLVLTTSIQAQPATVFLTTLQGQHLVPYTLINATGITVIAIPALMAMFLNRFIVRGILAGSSK